MRQSSGAAVYFGGLASAVVLRTLDTLLVKKSLKSVGEMDAGAGGRPLLRRVLKERQRSEGLRVSESIFEHQ